MKHTLKIFLTQFIVLLSLFTLCRELKIIQAEEEVPEVTETEEGPQYSASFRFTLADGNGTEELPEEVMAVLPETVEGLKDGDRIDAPTPSETQIGSFTFLGCEPPYAIIHGNDVIFSGIWRHEGSSMKLKAPSLKAASELYSGFGSLAWGLKEGTYIGTYNFLLGGRQAYCIEIEKSVPAAGSRYVYSGQDSSKIARIIGRGTANGMSPGAIQATVWNYVANDKSRAWVTTGESVDYDDARYSGGSCTIDIYVPDGNYQKFALLKGCNEPNQETKPGSIRILKKAQDLGISYLDFSSYSLEGAVYGIYSDQDCRNLKTKLTTKSDGTTDKATVEPGTWYVKEISASPGFSLDPKVYTAKVSEAADVTVTSTENAKLGTAYIQKRPADPSVSCPSPSYSLEGAVYGVYFDKQCKNLYQKFTTDKNGNTEKISLPAATWYVKEISASKGFLLDETIYTLNVVIDKTAAVTSSEVAKTGTLTIRKVADQADWLTSYPKSYSLEGAVYGIYSDSSCKTPVKKVTTDKNGNTQKISLPAGKWYVKEISASGGFRLDETVYPIDVVIDKTVSVTSTEIAKTGKIRILKKAVETGISLSKESYSLEGAVYGVYKDEKCEESIKELVTREDGTTEGFILPGGRFYVKEISASKGFLVDETIYPVDVVMEQVTDVTSIERPETGTARLKKKEADPSFSYREHYPQNYSLEGAVYGIYPDENCEEPIGTFTTGPDGNSEDVILPAGEYCVKEISASPGYLLDETVHPLPVRINDTAVIESKEEPIRKVFDVILVKQNAKDEDDIRYLEEAEFTLSYYDLKEADLEGSSPLYTWTFSPKIEDGKAIIRFDKDHLICEENIPCDEEGRLILPLGAFAIEETKAPQMYLKDESVYVGKITEDGIEWKDSGQITSEIKEGGTLVWTQKEEKVILQTTAIFEESGNDRYIADGVVHIIDTVEYDLLKPGKEYLLRTRLIRKKDRKVMAEEEMKWIPEKEDGTVDVPLECELEEGGDLVVFEYLYENDRLLSFHEDLEDEGQTVHADELYKASMVLYKVGGRKDILLNGAVFQVTGNRTRRDGAEIDTDYGRFVSGGIWQEREEPFIFELSKDETMKGAKEYTSSIHPVFACHHICITGLEDGIWYGRIKGQKEVRRYEIAQGMILIEDVPEDSILTYVEQIAPKGYYLAPDPYTVEVGHDTSLTRIENYRTNHALILPKTGVD